MKSKNWPARLLHLLKTNSGSFPEWKAAAVYVYGGYRLFARFLMSAAIEESDSGLVSDNVNTFAVGGNRKVRLYAVS